MWLWGWGWHQQAVSGSGCMEIYDCHLSQNIACGPQSTIVPLGPDLLHPLSLIYSPAATLASLFLKHTSNGATTGPLHFLFPDSDHSPDSCMTLPHFFIYFLKCHLCSKAFPGHPMNIAHSGSPLPCCTFSPLPPTQPHGC